LRSFSIAGRQFQRIHLHAQRITLNLIEKMRDGRPLTSARHSNVL
jgi:hypothetical protein